MSSSENSEGPGMMLAAEHAELDGLLRRLLEALGEGDRETAFARLDLFWARLAMHIRAEHLHLFPAILDAIPYDASKLVDKAPALAEARETITRLRLDHDFFMHELASAVKTMRELSAASGGEGRMQEVRRSIMTLKDRLEAHNRLEEEQVYHLPALILEAATQSALAVRMKSEIENLPPRFQ